MARNEKIAAVLHEIGIAETKGTGIRVMIDEMNKANLTIPIFESNSLKDSFTIKLLVHHLLSSEDLEWLRQFFEYNLSEDEARTLIVVREVGEINNFIYRSINRVDTLTASARLRHLRDLGLLDQKGKSSATYYTLNQNFTNKDLPNKLEKLAAPNPTSSTDKDLSSELTRLDSSNLASNPTDKDLSSELTKPDSSNLADKQTDNESTHGLLEQMPQQLRQVVENLGHRANTEELSNAIVQLCQWRDLSSSELAIILNRNQVYLRNNYLNRLIKLGKLEYVRSGSPSDPHQAYRAIAKNDAI